MEGGANSVCEASGRQGSGGRLRHPRQRRDAGQRTIPGYYPVGDTEALASLLEKAERDEDFYRSLRDGVRGGGIWSYRSVSARRWRHW